MKKFIEAISEESQQTDGLEDNGTYQSLYGLIIIIDIGNHLPLII